MSEPEKSGPVERGLSLMTNSRLATYRDCAKKHALTYLEGWRPAQDAEPLRLGNLFHVGLEAWWKCVARQDAHITSAEQAATFEIPDAEVGLAFQEAIAAVRAAAKTETDPVVQVKVEEMLRGYHMRWRYEALNFRVIAVERAFRCPLVNPATMRASGVYELAGKVDVIAESRTLGTSGVLEHKTTIEDLRPDAPYWLKLAMDPQISFYVLGAESLGVDVAWTLYDVARKPGEKLLKATPREEWHFKIRKTAEEKTWAEDDPRLVYANVRTRDETLEEYRARVRESLTSEEGLEKNYQRRSIARIASQMQEFLADTWAHVRAMRDLELAGRAPRNPAACDRYGMCWLWNHCANGEELREVGEGGKYRKLTFVHPELEGKV